MLSRIDVRGGLVCSVCRQHPCAQPNLARVVDVGLVGQVGRLLAVPEVVLPVLPPLEAQVAPHPHARVAEGQLARPAAAHARRRPARRAARAARLRESREGSSAQQHNTRQSARMTNSLATRALLLARAVQGWRGRHESQRARLHVNCNFHRAPSPPWWPRRTAPALSRHAQQNSRTARG